MRWLLQLCTVTWLMYTCLSLSGLDDVKSFAKCDESDFLCTNGRCISLAWKCDGDDDCGDNSDEEKCSPTTCMETQFRCNDGQCISKAWVCDGSSDCEDASDETTELCGECHRCANSTDCIPLDLTCDGTPDCQFGDDEFGCPKEVCDDKSKFLCKNSQCIDRKWMCDGTNDCQDGSDEENCPVTECDEVGEWACKNKECINELWRCDETMDCDDGSDEHNCPERILGQTCPSTDFQCKVPLLDTHCIHLGWWCDGDMDCEDGSDEENCVRTCAADEFLCDNSTCIRGGFVCDGDKDCKDGTDEAGCPPVTESPEGCSGSDFDCNNGQCISDTLLCNGVDDCGNSQDEISCPKIDKCDKDNGGCQQICISSPNSEGRRCECNVGFQMKENSTTDCEDIDECQNVGTCSQMCINLKGSFKCSCLKGYTLTHDRYCKAVGKIHPQLILSDSHEIRSYHLDNFLYSSLLDTEVSGAVAMDYDFRNHQMFWTDVHSERIYKADLNTMKKTAIITDNLMMPDGLAVDWVNGNMYFSDTGYDKIEVARLDGSSRKTLIGEGLDEPRALVVDPYHGWMYWTDWGSTPKIVKCGMNGKHQKIIVDTNIVWPNGLTIDYPGNRLYWVDAKLHSIGSSDLEGNNYKQVLKHHRSLGHPFAITVFEDHLYWTDWVTNGVYNVSKFTAPHEQPGRVAVNLKTPMDVQVFHELRQPSHNKHCGDNNGGCSHLCLPKPLLIDGPKTKDIYECACPDNFILDNERLCIKADSGVKPVPPTQPERPKPNANRPGQTPTSSNVTESPAGSVTDSTESLEQKPEGGEGAGYIAIIVIGVVAAIGILAGVVIFLLVRRYKKRNVKSMNFDNPIYRKTTTDDQLIMDKEGSRSSLPQSMQPLNETEVV